MTKRQFLRRRKTMRNKVRSDETARYWQKLMDFFNKNNPGFMMTGCSTGWFKDGLYESIKGGK